MLPDPIKLRNIANRRYTHINHSNLICLDNVGRLLADWCGIEDDKPFKSYLLSLVESAITDHCNHAVEYGQFGVTICKLKRGRDYKEDHSFPKLDPEDLQPLAKTLYELLVEAKLSPLLCEDPDNKGNFELVASW